MIKSGSPKCLKRPKLLDRKEELTWLQPRAKPHVSGFIFQLLFRRSLFYQSFFLCTFYIDIHCWPHLNESIRLNARENLVPESLSRQKHKRGGQQHLFMGLLRFLKDRCLLASMKNILKKKIVKYKVIFRRATDKISETKKVIIMMITSSRQAWGFFLSRHV